jgi:hypothetical protein
MSSRAGEAASSSRNSPTRRLLKELETWRAEASEEKGIERLGPPMEGNLLSWEAVINGRDIDGGYEGKLNPLEVKHKIRLTVTCRTRWPLAPRHHHSANLPAASTADPVRDAHNPR